ncbi:85calcium-independent phospholipase [Dirofilaria immitis]
MLDILKKVRDVATTQNREAVVNACGRAVTAVLTPKPKKVEVINASKLRNFTKCDDSFTFTLYVDKPKDGTYYVVYLPRALKIWYTRLRKDGELLRDQLNNLKLLVNILENENSKSNDFAAKLEQLRDSVIKNPSFDDIHHAAACNFSTIIIALCNNRPSIVNQASIDGCYPLHIAVKNNAKKAVQTLLSLGAHTAKQDCHSRSAVHYSAENPEILRLLSEAHDFADAIDMIDEDGLSPLCLAICSANIKCVELLLDANCSTGPFPGGSLAALVAVANSSSDLLKIVDLLLIRVPQFLVEEVNGSSTILHEKLEPKLLHHILGDLVDVVNINVRNGLNETPLHCAVARNDLSQSFALLTYNADVNIANGDGDTPLHMSVKNGSIQLVKLLLCFGASVQLKNDNEETALDVGRNNPEIMECLRLFVHSPLDVRSVSNDALFDLMQDRALEKRYQMTSKERQQLVNVISFDGGGIRGLILLQILLHIEKLLGHSVMKHFQWLCGTSTGAIIALGLAKGYSLRHCQNLYLHMKDELFVHGRPYPEKIIENFLCHIFGEKTTMAQLGPKKVIVTASYVQRNPPLLKLFRNYTLPVSEAENKALGYDNPCENLIWKCARYSSAAPTFFTPKDNFVDGGLMSNNPTLDLMADIHTYNAACIKAKKETIHVGCILSLGTGQAPPKDLGSIRWNFGLPGGLAEGVSMFQNLMNLKNLLVEQITASNGSCVTRARCWAHDQSIPFFRFSPSLSSHVELDEKNNDIIVNFLWETEKYLRTDGKHNVETLVKYLKSL